jgi:quercetin dioxygenase-like cupin family protein
VQIQPKQASLKAAADRFTGDVWQDAVAQAAAPSRLRATIVRFAPGARTAWHAHPVGQTLYVTEGRGRAQARGGQTIEMRPGDVVYTPPGEWHWHGAAPDHFMTHVSLVEVDDQRNSATWGDHVSDQEYGPAPEGRTPSP